MSQISWALQVMKTELQAFNSPWKEVNIRLENFSFGEQCFFSSEKIFTRKHSTEQNKILLETKVYGQASFQDNKSWYYLTLKHEIRSQWKQF